MEIVLGAILEKLQQRFKRRPRLMWALVAVVVCLGLGLAWIEWVDWLQNVF